MVSPELKQPDSGTVFIFQGLEIFFVAKSRPFAATRLRRPFFLS
jgi:hypothetical protein